MAKRIQKQSMEVGSGITHNLGNVNFTQVSYMGITALWVIGVLFYLLYLRRELSRRKQEEAVEDKKRNRHRGKRCPQCGNIISAHRKVCQHCGNEFSEVEVKESVESEAKETQATKEGGESKEHHHHHHSSSGRRRKKKRGKKCPQCDKVINHSREVCQHCGYKFDTEPKPGNEPEPAGPETKDAAN